MTSYDQNVIARTMNALNWKPRDWTELKARLEYDRTHPSEVTYLPGFKAELTPVFSEDEIRRAWGNSPGPSHIEQLLLCLRGIRRNNVHPTWTDSDTVTVKEIREAWQRKYPDSFPLRGADLADFLRDIAEHREPEYPYQSTWKDADNVVWQRTAKKMWRKMGQEGEFTHNYPKRPLKRMDVI